jgi:type I restriction enzyme S subunit
MEKTLIPSLRFKGFTEAWEQHKLGSIGSTYTGLSGKTKEDFGHGEARFVTYMNVFSNSISNPETVESVEIDNSQNQVQKGDVFFTTSSETPEEVGMSSVWLNSAENTYLNSFCFGYRPTILLNPYFLGSMLRSPSIRQDIVLLAQGISRYNISKTKVMDIEVPIPNLQEQAKIGSMFRSLDSLITLHQRKYAILVNVKKALLDKMFPKNGELVPSLRFKGFTDTWEQCKVGELGSIVTGNTPPTAVTDYYSDDGLIWVTPTDISQNITTSSARMLSEKGELVARVVPPQTVLITCIASIGKNTLLGSKGSFNQQINALVPALHNDPYFLFTQSNHWSSHMKRLGGALTFQIVNKKEFSELDTIVPKLQEQKKIGSLFNQLDSLITLHQRKYEKLINMKNALLQKMFV